MTLIDLEFQKLEFLVIFWRLLAAKKWIATKWMEID